MGLTNALQLRDRGWISPWHLSANGEHRIVTQSAVVGAGDLALEMGSAAALERVHVVRVIERRAAARV